MAKIYIANFIFVLLIIGQSHVHQIVRNFFLKKLQILT